MFDFYRLENGVRVILVPMAGVESVAVGVYVQTGSRYENTENNGISHFLEHMVFKGTKNYPTHEDTSKLEGMGAIQNAWTDVDATAYYCKIPADRWREALDLIKDLALYPAVPEKDLEIERGVIIEEINRLDDRPDELSGEVLMQQMYGQNPLGMRVIGTSEVIKKVQRSDFINYHSRQYTTGRMAVVIAGKMGDSKAGIKGEIEKHFGKLSGEKGGEMKQVDADELKSGFRILHKPLAAQAHVQFGFPGVTVTDARRFGLAVLTSHLGRGMSSRLFIQLREKSGLCYVVAANETRWTDTGIWSVYAGLALDKLEDAALAISSEVQRLKGTRLTEEELVQAKEKLRGPMLFSAENPINVMEFYAKQVLDKPEEIMTYDQVINRMMQIDAKDVLDVANDLLIKDRLNLAVVGPVDETRVQKLMEKVKI